MEVAGAALFFLLMILLASGTALVVASLSVLLGRRPLPPGVDASQVRVASLRTLRRYGAYWLIAAVAWAAGLLALRLITGS